MAHQLTVTGKTGPAKALTATVFSDVNELQFRLVPFVLRVVNGTGTNPQSTTDIDISAATTVTFTLSAAAGNATVSIS